MMKVRFIEKTDKNFTLNKKYYVICKDEKYYEIIDNLGNKIIVLKHRFKVVNSKKLKVGDQLLAIDLQDWCRKELNEYKDEWRTLAVIWLSNRTIEEIEIKDGHKAFLVSGTSDIWIRAKGYRKFCKR